MLMNFDEYDVIANIFDGVSVENCVKIRFLRPTWH